MHLGEDSLDNSGVSSIKDALKKKRQKLKLEIEKTELELETIEFGESIAAFLNKDEKLKALLVDLNVDQMEQPLTLRLTWDGTNRRFTQAMLQEGASNIQTPKPAPAVESRTNTPVKRRAAKPFSQRPPQEEEYFIPILQALRHFGWSATPEQITPLVLEKMRPKLSENDFERIPSGMFIRWECRMRFARKRMKDQYPPLLNPNSPRGLWEATDAGRRYLEEME